MFYSQMASAIFGVFLGGYLGPENYGLINLARNFFIIGLVLTPLGLDLALQRRFGGGDYVEAAAELHWQRAIVFCLASLVALLAYFGGAAWLEAQMFRHAGFAGVLVVTLAALPLASDMSVLGGAYRGAGRPAPSLAATYLAQPTARILLIACLFTLVDRVAAVTWGGLGSYALAWLLLAAMARRDFKAAHQPPTARRALRIFAYAPTLGLSTLLFTLARASDLVILGAYAPAADVGRYAIVLMAAQTIAIVGAALGQTLATRVATASATGDAGGVIAMLRGNMELSAKLSAPLCVAVAVWGHDVDLALGQGYRIATPVFVAAALAQWIMTIAQSSSAALSMTGRHRLELANNAAMLLVALAAGLVLTPALGMLGAALASLIAMAAVNVLRQIEIAVIFKQPVIRRSMLTPLGLAVLGAMPWIGVEYWLSGRAWWMTGLLALAQIATSFALILAFGLSSAWRRPSATR